jgi:large subunit ribosomal protein L9
VKVILTKDVLNLGKEGATLEVKDGYARNYLLPNKLAFEATKDNLVKLEELKRTRMKLLEVQKKSVIEIKTKLEAISVTLTASAKDDEEIFGSITEGQILKALKEEGIELEKGKIELESPIKKIGVYNLKVKLHPEVDANLRVWIVKK